jgi:hypothetical protein
MSRSKVTSSCDRSRHSSQPAQRAGFFGGWLVHIRNVRHISNSPPLRHDIHLEHRKLFYVNRWFGASLCKRFIPKPSAPSQDTQRSKVWFQVTENFNNGQLRRVAEGVPHHVPVASRAPCRCCRCWLCLKRLFFMSTVPEIVSYLTYPLRAVQRRRAMEATVRSGTASSSSTGWLPKLSWAPDAEGHRLWRAACRRSTEHLHKLLHGCINFFEGSGFRRAHCADLHIN